MNPLLVLEATGRPFVLGLDWVLTTLGVAARAMAAIPAMRHGPARDEFLGALRHALPGSLLAVMVAAWVLGLTLIGQGLYWLTFASQQNLIRTLMVDVLVRELAPMLAALVLLARYGTRNIIELAAIRAGPAWRGLAGQGIDPWRTLVAPRAHAAALAGFAHTIFSVVLAALGGHLTALVLGASTLRPVFFLATVLDGMQPRDFLLVALKGPVLGFAVVVVSAVVALASPQLATETRRVVPRGLALTALALPIASLLLSAVL